MIYTTKDLDREIKNSLISGAYLFYGQEIYLKRYYINAFRNVICPDSDFEVFDHVIIGGGDLKKLENEVVGVGFFASNRLVELRDTDFGGMSAEDLQYLCDLISDLDGVTVLIDALPDELPEGTAKKPSAQLAALQKVAKCVNFERQTPQKLALWVSRHIAASGCSASPEVCRMIVDYCSPDMFILSGEVQKLTSYTLSRGETEIDSSAVLDVCSQNRVFGAFDFANAILAGDNATALAVFAKMKLRREKPQDIMGTLSRITGELLTVRELLDCGLSKPEIGQIMKMADYPLTLRINAVKNSTRQSLCVAAERAVEADLKLKSTSLPGYLVIEQFILESVHKGDAT